MNIVTDVTIDTTGADPVLTVTKSQKNTETGVLTETTSPRTSSLTVLAPFKLASGDPPTDGTVANQCYYDITTGAKYINTAWPNIAAPTWVEI